MGIFRDRIKAEMADNDSRIEYETKTATERIRALKTKQNALEGILGLLTPELELAIIKLQKTGILGAI